MAQYKKINRNFTIGHFYTQEREEFYELEKKRERKKEKYLLVGCVIHSIQDYFAHSYVSGLADYKENIKLFTNGKTSYLHNKANAYHRD